MADSLGSNVANQPAIFNLIGRILEFTLYRSPKNGKMKFARISMLSRGKLVQDWRRRLAAAEAEGAEGPPQTWLYQMRVRLYRFLISCYQDTDWRADEPSTMTDETSADATCGDTTTLLDVRLEGKPAKTLGKLQAVLKSVSAAQEHPAPAGPLLSGIAADDWVLAVSASDKLRMGRCQALLRQYGIASTWTLPGELNVRLCDLERVTQIIQKYRDSLRIKAPLDLPRVQAIAN